MTHWQVQPRHTGHDGEWDLLRDGAQVMAVHSQCDGMLEALDRIDDEATPAAPATLRVMALDGSVATERSYPVVV